MKKQEVYTKTTDPHRGSYLVFNELAPEFILDGMRHITSGKRYKITEVKYVNLHTNEKEYRFIDDKGKTDSVSTKSKVFPTIEFFDLNLVLATAQEKSHEQNAHTTDHTQGHL